MKLFSVFIILVAVLLGVATTSAEAQQLPPSDLYALYAFDDTSGTAFTDTSEIGLLNSTQADFYSPFTYEELPAIDVSNVAVASGGAFGDGSIGIGVRPIGTEAVDHQMMIDIPSSTNLPGTGDSFAVSFWVSSDNWASTAGIIGAYNVGGLEWSMGFANANGLLLWSGDADGAGTDQYQIDTAGLTNSTYANFIVQFEGTAGITGAYLNGTSAASLGLDSAWWGREYDGFTMGARVCDARPYTVPNQNPHLDDFAIIDGVITPADISALYNSGAGDSSLDTKRLAHYAMNDSTGTQITDSSTNANHGTLIGYDPVAMGPALHDVSSTNRPGVFGTSAEFAAGSPERAEMTSVDAMPGAGEAFTVAFWMKPDDLIARDFGWDQGFVLSSWNHDGLGFSVGTLNQSDGNIIVRVTDGSAGGGDTYGIHVGFDEGNGLNLDATVLHHFAVTVDEDGIVTGIYVDGTYAPETYSNGWNVSDPETGAIGHRITNGNPGNYASAYLDDFGVIRGELTEAQIAYAIEHGVLELCSDETDYAPGDANRDGFVDDADAEILATYWLKATGATWAQGDFNGDEKVDAIDVTLMAANWLPDTGVAVPEPSTIVLLATLMLMLGMVRTRSR